MRGRETEGSITENGHKQHVWHCLHPQWVFFFFANFMLRFSLYYFCYLLLLNILSSLKIRLIVLLLLSFYFFLSFMPHGGTDDHYVYLFCIWTLYIKTDNYCWYFSLSLLKSHLVYWTILFDSEDALLQQELFLELSIKQD